MNEAGGRAVFGRGGDLRAGGSKEGMKTEKTIYRVTAACFTVIVFLFGGCSAKGAAPGAVYRSRGEAVAGYAVSQNALAEESAAESAADAGGPNIPEAGAVPGTEASRKLVYRASISIRVQEPEKAGAALTALMDQYGAYASSVNIRENSRYYTLRVPAASYPALLSALDGMGRLLHRSESAEDVTLRYYDLEGRLATKRWSRRPMPSRAESSAV